jgi:hypothetical protein
MTDAATDVRDRLTRRRLVAALPSSSPRVLSFTSHWWDGACHVPSLVARVGGRRLRAVETHRGVILLPASASRARRALQSWRHTPMGGPLAPSWARLTTSPGVHGTALPGAPGPAAAAGVAAAGPPELTIVPGPPPGIRLQWQPVRLPAQRPAPEMVHISQDVVVASCPVARCGGLRVLPAPGQAAAAAASCPCCGLAA